MAYTVTTALGVFLLQTNVDSLKINYMDKGSGELVVLLHGWGSNIELFENMSELLARKYHVVAPDMPGFGLSDEPKEPWRVDDYVDFVLKFLEPFAPKKVTFLGHSFGGRVIIKMASRRSCRCILQGALLLHRCRISRSCTSRCRVLFWRRR